MDEKQTELKPTGERLMVSYKNKTAVEHLHRYSIAQTYVKDKVVLDIASGEGYGSNLLAQDAKYVYGVDIAPDAVRHANAKYSKSNLSFLEGSAAAIPLEDNSVDVLVSFETIEHHNKHEEMMQECRRVLKEDGIFIISSPDKKYFSDLKKYQNEFHVKELYKDEFYALVKRYFGNVQLYKQGIVKGSLVYLEGKGQSDLRIFTGNYEAVNELVDIECPEFNVIVASQKPIDPIADSFFESAFVDGEINEQLATYRRMYEDILSSKSYKIARLLALPQRILKRFF